jgi:DNA-directed RNA polymerase sigma subunit (sigma70/sigma32)
MSKQYERVVKHLSGEHIGLSLWVQQLLRLRFGLEDGRQRTYEELAIIFGSNRERIRHIESISLKTINRYEASRARDAEEGK